MNEIFIILLCCVFAYLLGSICSAILVCKALGYPDPRTDGSSNPGTTNVLRLAGKGPALLTFFGDFIKAVIPVMLARLLGLELWCLGLVGFCAFLGHLFPIFFRFQGGKGVATAVGLALAINYVLGLAIIFSWIIVALISRYSSLAALISWLLAPLYAALIVDCRLLFSFIPITLLLFFRHKSNIVNLIKGEEGKIGQNKK